MSRVSPKGDATMALHKPKERKANNLSLLVQAIAQAYHRGPSGRPAFQPISFKTGISTAAIHLWKKSAVTSARPDYLHTLADCYRLDFAKVLGYVYGPPSKLEDDALLASLRPDDDNGQGARVKRIRPIGGGSEGPPGLHVVEVLAEMFLVGRWLRRLLAPWARPLLPLGCPA